MFLVAYGILCCRDTRTNHRGGLTKCRACCGRRSIVEAICRRLGCSAGPFAFAKAPAERHSFGGGWLGLPPSRREALHYTQSLFVRQPHHLAARHEGRAVRNVDAAV